MLDCLQKIKEHLKHGLVSENLLPQYANEINHCMSYIPISEQRNISPDHCNADIQAMKQFIELVKNTDYYFSRLFSVQVSAHTCMHIMFILKYVIEKQRGQCWRCYICWSNTHGSTNSDTVHTKGLVKD